MRLEELELGSNVTIQAHIGDKMFTTEASVAKVTSDSVILRLLNVELFDTYAEKTDKFSLCYKSGFEMNFISDITEVLHSQSNPQFICMHGETELTAVHAQRSHVRYPYSFDLVLSQGTENFKVHSIDISSSGVGVMGTRSFSVGTTVYVDIYNPVTRKSRSFRARVANCTQKKLNEYFIGLLFVSTEQWILDFINDLQAKVLQDVG